MKGRLMPDKEDLFRQFEQLSLEDRLWFMKKGEQTVGGSTSYSVSSIDRKEQVNKLLDLVHEDATDKPPDELLAELTTQQREILKYLWRKGTADYDSIYGESEGFSKAVEPDSVGTAVNRLGTRLVEIKAKDRFGIWLEVNAPYAALHRE